MVCGVLWCAVQSGDESSLLQSVDAELSRIGRELESGGGGGGGGGRRGRAGRPSRSPRLRVCFLVFSVLSHHTPIPTLVAAESIVLCCVVLCCDVAICCSV